MGFVAPLLLGLLVLLSLRQSRQPLTGRTWVLLRSLLPSWRFFEDVEPGPELQFCVARAGDDAWQPVLVPPRRRGFFLNASGNLYLAQQSLVEQLWSELDGATLDEAKQLTSYRLVQRLVTERAKERYRFRLVTGSEVDFESEEHEP